MNDLRFTVVIRDNNDVISWHCRGTSNGTVDAEKLGLMCAELVLIVLPHVPTTPEVAVECVSIDSRGTKILPWPRNPIYPLQRAVAQPKAVLGRQRQYILHSSHDI